MPDMNGVQIDHVVVLMLENRGFDHVMGYLYDAQNKPRNPSQAHGSLGDFVGLDGVSLSCKYDYSPKAGGNFSDTLHPRAGARAANVPRINASESFINIIEDLYNPKFMDGSPDFSGPEDFASKAKREAIIKQGAKFKKPTMNGWAQNYARSIDGHAKAATYKDQISEILDIYLPEQLPVLSGLARHYAISDQWFCSVPSQTNTNRAFSVAGNSAGLVTNNFYDLYLSKADTGMQVAGAMSQLLFPHVSQILDAINRLKGATHQQRFDQWFRTNELTEGGSSVDSLPLRQTLFDVLEQNGKSWRYYWSASALPPFASMPPYTRALFPQFLDTKFDSNFPQMEQFYADARSGSLPAVSYLEPILGGGKDWSGALRAISNDFHSVSDSICAEFFVKSIYDAVSMGPAWERTLLIITFDENGGTFDHFPPPAAEPPGVVAPLGVDLDRAPDNCKHPECDPDTRSQFGFEFDIYGCRVCTILVSPYIKPGTVFRSPTEVPFDHTSLIATILKWQQIPLGAPMASRAKVPLGEKVTAPLKPVPFDTKAANLGGRVAKAPTFESVLGSEARDRNHPELGVSRYGLTLLGARDKKAIRYGDPFYLRYVGNKWPDINYRGYLTGPESHLETWYPVLEPQLSKALQFHFEGQGDTVHNGDVLDIVAPAMKGLLVTHKGYRLAAPHNVPRSNMVSLLEDELAKLMPHTIWFASEASLRSKWQIWLLRDRAKDTQLCDGDEVLILWRPTAPIGPDGLDAAWNLDFHATRMSDPPIDPYQKLTVDDPPNSGKRYLKLRAAEWDIWQIKSA